DIMLIGRAVDLGDICGNVCVQILSNATDLDMFGVERYLVGVCLVGPIVGSGIVGFVTGRVLKDFNFALCFICRGFFGCGVFARLFDTRSRVGWCCVVWCCVG
ncbi:hypothetical protein B0T26DRAFT_725087, partial [Lasiosphaeria miniovina]